MDTFTRGLLNELEKAEAELAAKDEVLRQAEINRAIAMTTYCTVRDHLRQELSRSPYALTQEEWPYLSHEGVGRFRYARMRLGDAAEAALEDHGPMRLDTLTDILRSGGLVIPSERELHAMLINKKGIVREGNKIKLMKEVKNEDTTGDR